MDAASIVEMLRSRGITLAIYGDKLIVDHHGEMVDADRDTIRTHKAALLALLAGPPVMPDRRAPASAFGRWLTELVAYHEATGRLAPLRQWPRAASPG
jgi:hypothetical protein